MKGGVVIVNVLPPARMPQKHRCCNLLEHEAKQFCSNTAMHGYRYIVLPNRILLERVLWSVVVILSLVTAVILLTVAWFQFQESPTLIVTDSTHNPIWNYPFPAVTLCNYNKISKTEAKKLARKLKKPYDITDEELLSEFKLLYYAFHYDINQIKSRNFTRLQDILETNDMTLNKALQKLSPKCKDSLLRCVWKGEERKCESMFEEIITFEGFCCTFNYFALKNHTFEGTMASKAPKKPRRVSATGIQTALEIMLDSHPDDYFATQIPSFGHKVLIHDAYDYPDWTVQTILAENRRINLIGLNMDMTYATPDVESMTVGLRRCFFKDEFHLRNFAHYTYKNCMIECRLNVSRRLCGCIPFFYYNGDATVGKRKPRICTLRDISCLSEYRYILWTSEPHLEKAVVSSSLTDIGLMKRDCNCLPECEYFRYTAEASSGALERSRLTNQKNLYGGVHVRNQSVIRVFQNDLVAPKNRRDVSFNWHTLLGYYGGVLGLFTGCSFVSIMEIIYYLLIKPIANAVMPETIKEETQHRTNKERILNDYDLSSKEFMTNLRNNQKQIKNSNRILYLN